MRTYLRQYSQLPLSRSPSQTAQGTTRYSFSMRHFCVFALGAVATLAHTAARAGIDCPLRNQPYSIDSPMIDVMLKPDAKAAVQREAPGLLSMLPPMMSATTSPSFGSIISLRMVSAFGQVSPEDLARTDQALSQLSVTNADRVARCARYDDERPHLQIPPGHPRLLLFEKITGFRDAPSVSAADAALRSMAQQNGWSLVATDKGGAITPSILKNFDAVIWN